jgi:plastocyanin
MPGTQTAYLRKKTGALLILLQLLVNSINAQTDTINIYNMSFEPETITITPGEKIIWMNRSNLDHTSTSGSDCVKDGKWNSGYISHDQSYSHVFDSVGTYNYFCLPHCLSGMKGKIIVKSLENQGQEKEPLKKK